MFTGIIEKSLKIKSIQKRGGAVRIALDLAELADGVCIGHSIALDGVCLTVVDLSGRTAHFDAVEETLARTTLGALEAGALVNIERSLRVGDRVGGHFVQGHVDGVGTIREKRQQGAQWTYVFSVPRELTDFMVPKGSVAVDGISLTLVEVRPAEFSVAVIPHTLSVTTLGRKGLGALVNVECDMIGRYVAKLLRGQGPKSNITEEFLREHGF
jgi:riboflavin synthase